MGTDIVPHGIGRQSHARPEEEQGSEACRLQSLFPEEKTGHQGSRERIAGRLVQRIGSQRLT